jgi:2-polyprenyl-6-methoxyphenol hydroxylase-like FAD-dependent oxidoreductase
MSEHDVVIAGGGPTGMMLASELTLAGVDVVVVERRAKDEPPPSRAGGLHPRSIEVLDQRGVAERFLEAGQVMQTTGFAGIPLDISDFPVRRNHGLALWQPEIERILAGWADELGVPVRFESEVTGFTCGRPTWSAATADAAWSASRPASSSPAGTRRRAG